jgi:hypothetical protein
MELVADYLRREEDCRKLALLTQMMAHRKIIEEMCDMWARLAEERRRYLVQQQSNNSPT